MFKPRERLALRRPVNAEKWYNSEKTAEEDVAVLDLTDELEHSSIDLDNGYQVKFATSDRFNEIGIKTGNSGSPMFVLENGITYLVGIFSCGLLPENKYAGVVPLDNLIKLLDGREIPYFKPMNDGASCDGDVL